MQEECGWKHLTSHIGKQNSNYGRGILKNNKINEQTKSSVNLDFDRFFVWKENKLNYTVLIILLIVSIFAGFIRIKIQVFIRGRTLNMTLLKGVTVTLKKEQDNVMEWRNWYKSKRVLQVLFF